MGYNTFSHSPSHFDLLFRHCIRLLCYLSGVGRTAEGCGGVGKAGRVWADMLRADKNKTDKGELSSTAKSSVGLTYYPDDLFSLTFTAVSIVFIYRVCLKNKLGRDIDVGERDR